MFEREDGSQESQRGPFKRQYKYYELLGISREATIEEIKKAYLRLVKIYHPDINADPEAGDKIKLINRAYQVLGNVKSRVDYDTSPAECPACYTHEVIQTIELLYRCRSCGCKFDASRPLDIIETVERAAIPEKRRAAIRVFQSTQCSWCSKFYTNEPFLCPPRRLQSNCFFVQRLDASKRRRLLGEERWWWRMSDMLQTAEDKGIIAKCRYCMALNPNPQKISCWHCGKDALRCPECNAKPYLRFSTETNKWKCPNASCSKSFAFVPKRIDKDQYKGQKITRVYKEKDAVKKKLKTRHSLRWLTILIAFLAIVMFGIIIWATIGNQILYRLRIALF